MTDSETLLKPQSNRFVIDIVILTNYQIFKLLKIRLLYNCKPYI